MTEILNLCNTETVETEKKKKGKKSLTYGGPHSALSAFPTGRWPRSPASTPIDSHLGSADVETLLQRSGGAMQGDKYEGARKKTG